MVRVIAVCSLAVLFGCSSATVFRMTRANGTVIEAKSAKQQNEESAKWAITVGADDSIKLDLGTKGTSPVNMTSEVLNSIISLIPGGK